MTEHAHHLSSSLRPVRDGDIEFLEGLYAGTRESEMAVVPWSEQEKVDFLQMQFVAQTAHYGKVFPDAEFSIIEVAGERIGRLYLDRREDEIRIIDIALLPKWRGRGLGGRLLKKILQEAADRGIMARIHVEANNPALSLYGRLGFRHVESNGVYHLMEWVHER